ncbi:MULTISPECIES: hypothetical protein [unclassified Variovorax]|jgi:hypothetical protein|uniref:hypothetical protein n=1 Tax=unclassified Variovorax TaxID=663243 RepID=UPI000F7F60F7|nr:MULTISPECIES: hypothetical protein [unclassified Variovorax]RSZ32246.1 hypothetical protein EJO70_30110 [Variovorax sp. 553]RSZ32592.1 hypothetical protein EJO71_30420 [Variovorax sp. 679]
MVRTGRHTRATAAAALAAAAVAGLAPPAHAVITTVTDTGSSYMLTLRVGTVGATVDTVAFSVTGANAGLTPTAVTGTPTIDVWVMPVRPIANTTVARPVTLRVDSSAGLSCQSGGCGSTIIPFSKISWVATGNSNAASGDIQNGRFDTTANQSIASYDANATFCVGPLGLPCVLGIGTWTYLSRNLTATRLQFSYDNDVIYPGGNYKGTVRFTASME